MNFLPIVDNIDACMSELRSMLCTVGIESCKFPGLLGRVLAEPVLAMRDSPAMDVSAMDGYALRKADLDRTSLSVAGTIAAGHAPISLPPSTAVRVFTGAAIPPEAEMVVQRELCHEQPDSIELRARSTDFPIGMNIRRRGENVRAGEQVIASGQHIQSNTLAGIATFCRESQLRVFRPLRVSIINTGDELVSSEEPVEPWQIRDSNGPMLEAMLSPQPWLRVRRLRVKDTLDSIEQTIREELTGADSILLTGGVSMGDLDFVPQAVQNAGGKIVFHRIPIRPGKPMLGAATADGKLIMGLPGNPLSVAITFRRYGLGMLQKMAGFSEQEVAPKEQVLCDNDKKLDLLWFRLVKRRKDGMLCVEPSQGSGDIASLARCDGFVEVPPGESTSGVRRFYRFDK